MVTLTVNIVWGTIFEVFSKLAKISPSFCVTMTIRSISFGLAEKSASLFSFISNRLTYLQFSEGWAKFLPFFVVPYLLRIVLSYFFRCGRNFSQLFYFPQILLFFFLVSNASSRNFS